MLTSLLSTIGAIDMNVDTNAKTNAEAGPPRMILVDVHAHLDDQRFARDLIEVIRRAKENGIVAIITQGVSHEKNMRLLKLAKRDPIIKVAFGIYPLNAPNVRTNETPDATQDHEPQSEFSVDDTLSAIEEHRDDIVAIGEVGMDLHFSDDKETQRDNFRKVVRLAKTLGKPLIVHSRKAEKDVLDILDEECYTKAVMHCFMGSRKLLDRGIGMGLMFSIPAAVVRNAQFQENAERIPIGQLLTETDAPYLPPTKGERNEPAAVRQAVEKIAAIKRMDAKECANAIYRNYQRMFL